MKMQQCETENEEIIEAFNILQPPMMLTEQTMKITEAFNILEPPMRAN
jgi:hypothetical protein